MILLDALHINNGGGKVLLDYLITELEAKEKNVFYLLDARVKNKVPPILHGEVKFLHASLYRRWHFYATHKNNFSKVLCFADIAPPIKLKAIVYTYFQQHLYFNFPNSLPIRFATLFWLKRQVFKKLLPNTDYLIVQNGYTKEQAIEQYGLPAQKVKCIPFFPPFKSYPSVTKVKHSYIYVSDGPPHKNHIKLITSFCKFFDINQKGSLVLTVSSDFVDLNEFISAKQNEGYPVMNIGFIEREILADWYSKTEYLVFPSLAESFGLALAEATAYGCKIIASNLPYVHEMCQPSLTFDPESENSIIDALTKSLDCEELSHSKVENQILELTALLS